MQLIFHRVDLRLNHTFTIAHDSRDVQPTLIVELRDGAYSGFGEATATRYYGITIDGMVAALEAIRNHIESYALTDPEVFWAAMQPYLAQNPFALCALDQAAWDLWAKKKQQPLYKIWNLDPANSPLTDYTIGLDTPERMVEKMQERPWPLYKIKLGRPDKDMTLVTTLREHTDAIFRVDANCGWTAADAIRKSHVLKELGVEFIEQPLPADDWEGAKFVYEQSALPIIADESCIIESDVDRCAGYFHGVNIKLTKCGGLTSARRMIGRARELGLQVMVGCMTESSVGISAIAQLLPLLDYADLDGAMLIANDPATGVTFDYGKVVYRHRKRDRSNLIDTRMSEIFHIDQLPNRTVAHGGQEYLFFSGTAYLGIPQHPAFHQLMVDSMRRYGTVFGSSRNGNVRIGVYEEAEAKLADRIGAEAALTVSSGMIAGQVIVNWLRSQHTTFIYAPHAHPALWHEPTVTLPDMSFAAWTAQLTEQLSKLPAGPVAILTNSLDAVCSDYYSFDWVNDLPEDRPITLVVDDSHGLGILNQGRGIWPQLPQKAKYSGNRVRVLGTGSLAKGMGLPGGVVFGDTDTVKTIRETAFFGACSPMAPACLDAYLRADALYKEGYERLQENIQLAEKLLLPTGLFRHASGYPVFFTEQDALYTDLLKHNILIYSFAYPTPAHRANTRIVISAFHEPSDIKQVANRISVSYSAAL